jgi:hypothetical protein
MKYLISLLIILFITRNAFAMDINALIADTVKNSKILSVSIEPIPNDDAVTLKIVTTRGERNIILTKENLPLALAALKNPQITGPQNASVSKRIVQHGALISYMAPPQGLMLASNSPQQAIVPEGIPPQTVSTAPAAPPALMPAAIASANQQASR